MKNKNIVRYLTAIFLVSLLSLSIISCGKDKKDKEKSDDTDVTVKVVDTASDNANDGWSPIWKP